MTRETDVGTLARKVAARRRFLYRTVAWVEKLLQENGDLIKRYEGSSHTNVVKQLLNFGGFSFRADWGQTDFGGNEVKVWYHPRVRKSGAGNIPETTLVLSVYYQTSMKDDCRVDVFDEHHAWQSAFNRALRRRYKIVEGMKKREQKIAAEKKRETERREKISRLEDAAKKLGVKIEKDQM